MSKTKEFIEFIQKFNEFMEDKTMRVAFVNYLNSFGKIKTISENFVYSDIVSKENIEEDVRFLKRKELIKKRLFDNNDYYFQEVESFHKYRNNEKFILCNKQLYKYKSSIHFENHIRPKLIKENINLTFKRYVKIYKHYEKNNNIITTGNS